MKLSEKDHYVIVVMANNVGGDAINNIARISKLVYENI